MPLLQHLPITFLLFISTSLITSVADTNPCSSFHLPGDIFMALTNKTRYNKSIRPPSLTGGPLVINTRLYLYHLLAKETTKLDISMQILLELSWRDPRLEFTSTKTTDVIIGGGPFSKAIWTPHIIFANEKDSCVMMGSNKKDDLVTLLPSGLVLLTTRLKASMVCKLHLGNFPFDQQNCHLSMDSWRYNTSQLMLKWDLEEMLQIGPSTKTLLEFDIIQLKNDSSAEKFMNHNRDHKFSSLMIRLRLARRYGYYFMNYYLPSELLVIISWVTFWLSPDAVPGRVTLGSSTMLTFIQLSWSGQGVPKVSQFKANDLWTITCTAFIFLSLAEFAFVNTIHRKGKDRVRIKKPTTKYILRGGVSTASGSLGRTTRRSSSCPSSPEIRRHFQRARISKANTFKELREVSKSLQNLPRLRETLFRRREPYSSSQLDCPTVTAASVLPASEDPPPVVLLTSSEDQTLVVLPPPPSSSEDHLMFSMTPQEIADWIDQKSRIVFPLTFLIFNITYWLPLFIV